MGQRGVGRAVGHGAHVNDRRATFAGLVLRVGVVAGLVVRVGVVARGATLARAAALLLPRLLFARAAALLLPRLLFALALALMAGR